ncbi:MAG: AfsR/SARP family transcriptional regulator [Anaerolineae bacterium]
MTKIYYITKGPPGCPAQPKADIFPSFPRCGPTCWGHPGWSGVVGSCLSPAARPAPCSIAWPPERNLSPENNSASLFWPDAPEATARRNLTHLLTHLCCALPEPDLLLIAEDCIGLDSRRAWSDVEVFERLCAALPSSSLRRSSPLPTLEEAESLRQAVDLYRGPFLAGFSLPGSREFETWANQTRYVWEHLYLEALMALRERWAASGDYASAIACARRYLETDELAEDVHRRLIQFYAAAGDRRAALRQFERCAVVLERELGVSPLPETRAVYQAVLTHQPVPHQARCPYGRPCPAWMCRWAGGMRRCAGWRRRMHASRRTMERWC